MKALAAGKHVLSEKPVAKDVEDAKALLQWYEGLGEGRPVWGVAENFRFWESVVFAVEKVKEIGGEVVSFGFEMFKGVPEEDKYFNTACRWPHHSPSPTRCHDRAAAVSARAPGPCLRGGH